MSYRSASDFPAEVERVLRITDGILRSMTTVAAPKKASPAKENQPEEAAVAESAAE